MNDRSEQPSSLSHSVSDYYAITEKLYPFPFYTGDDEPNRVSFESAWLASLESEENDFPLNSSPRPPQK